MGWSLLHLAAALGLPECVSFLLQHKCDVQGKPAVCCGRSGMVHQNHVFCPWLAQLFHACLSLANPVIADSFLSPVAATKAEARMGM